MDDPLEGVRADLTATTGQISAQVRTIVLGLLAFVWLFLSGAKDIPAPMVKAMPKAELVSIAILCMLALAVDLLQYIVGYVYSKSVLNRAESTGAAPVYDSSSRLYRTRLGLFWAKQALALGAGIWLIAMLARAVAA